MQTKMDSHFSEDLMERYVLGHLPEELSCGFEEHVLLCESCQTRLEQVELFVRVAAKASAELRLEKRAARAAKLKPSWWSIPKPVWAGAMAALLFCIAIPIYRLDGDTAPVEVAMQARRGTDKLVAHAPAGKIVLQIDASELQGVNVFQMELADAAGRPVWKGPVATEGGYIRVAIPVQLRRGDFVVRLYSEDSTVQLREFALEIQKHFWQDLFY